MRRCSNQVVEKGAYTRLPRLVSTPQTYPVLPPSETFSNEGNFCARIAGLASRGAFRALRASLRVIEPPPLWMTLLLGLIPLARAPLDMCIQKPGVQCTGIRATNKFDLHDDRYTSGAILVTIGDFLREGVDTTTLDGDTFGASATYEISLNDGKATRPYDTSNAKKVPGLGAHSDGQHYAVKCGHQEWARHLGLCTIHIESAPFALGAMELNESVALGNFPMPKHYKPGVNFNHAPASFYSTSLAMLFVLFPISNSSSTHALELIRIPILKADSKHWDARMEVLNGGMGRNFSLCSTPPCASGSEYRHMTASTFHLEHLGVNLGNHESLVVYDDLQVIGLQDTSVDYDHSTVPSECCDTSGNTVPNCAHMYYFRYGVPCEGGKLEGDPGCTEAGHRGLLPLPNLGSLTTLVDARYAPAMIYTCISDGAGGINITASNIANVPDPYCMPKNGHTPADCLDFEHHPSYRLFHIPSANITTDPFLEKTPGGVPVWSILLLVILGCLVLVVAVALPLWWLLQGMKKHKYETVA